MSRLFWRALKAVPVVIVGSLVAANTGFAQSVPTNEANVDSTLEQIGNYQGSGNSSSMSQVTNVNQLRDVSPSDWAYEALRSLVDRYGCIAGYPNQTYRGSRALSRYEFAAGLNSCLNQIERLIASSEAIVREDIDTINRLTQEFEAELATLGGRIDSLESRTAFLEDHQFSTTTKLKGEVIFALVDTFGDVNDEDPTEVTFSDRVRLNFDSSFYGKDRLRIRLQAANIVRLDRATGFDATRLGFDSNNGNNVAITDIHYRFPLGDKFRGYVGAAGLDIDDVFDTINPLESSGSGALSRFVRKDPIVFRGAEGAGVGFNYELGEALTVSGLYLAEDAADPGEGNDDTGLIDGSFSTGAQVEFELGESVELRATYIYEFLEAEDVNLSGSTSSDIAQEPFEEVDTTAHQFGLGATVELSESILLAAWGGLSLASEADGDDNATLFTAGGSVSLLDVGKEGAVLSIGGGIPPHLSDNDNEEVGEDEDMTFLVEAQYKFPVNDNILLTPGAYVVFNPEGNSDNDTQVIGVLRTTFKF